MLIHNDLINLFAMMVFDYFLILVYLNGVNTPFSLQNFIIGDCFNLLATVQPQQVANGFYHHIYFPKFANYTNDVGVIKFY